MSGRRFVNNKRWREAWYRKLAPRLKLLWDYIYDNTDQAGVWEADFDLATFSIGDRVEVRDLIPFGDRIKKISETKYWIPEYIEFQNGKLSHACLAHKPIFKLIEKYGLAFETAKATIDEGQLKFTPTGEQLRSAEEIYSEIAADEIFIQKVSMVFPGQDIEKAFHECYLYFSQRPSPPIHAWEWRAKLVTSMGIKPFKSKQNGKTTQQERVDKLIQEFAQRNK